MADENLKCFQEKALGFLDNELASQEDARLTLFGQQISAKSVARDSFDKLLTKGPKPFAKSIAQHLGEFASSSLNFAEGVSGDTQDKLTTAFSAFGKSVEKVGGGLDSALNQVISAIGSNKSTVYSMAKNSSRRASRLARERISKSSEIINTINTMIDLRKNISSQALSASPTETAELVSTELGRAVSLMNLVSVSSSRLPDTYDNAVLRLSESLDLLKIGAGQFTLHEYMRLRLDFKILINEFSEIDLDILAHIDRTISAEDDFNNNKNGRKNAEQTYIKEIVALLADLINEINTVVANSVGSENAVLEQFPEWSQTLTSIYIMAYGAYDDAVEQTINDEENEDKQSYTSLQSTYTNLRTNLTKQELVILMNQVAEDQFNFLLGNVTEESLRTREEQIKSELVQVSQDDQLLIDADSGYNPVIAEILTVITLSAQRAGLDQLASAIQSGDVAGLFGLLTEELGSTASEAATCLGSSIETVENPATRDLLLRVNSRVQAIQRKEQLAGQLREGNYESALRAVDSDISGTKRLREQLAALEL